MCNGLHHIRLPAMPGFSSSSGAPTRDALALSCAVPGAIVKSAMWVVHGSCIHGFWTGTLLQSRQHVPWTRLATALKPLTGRAPTASTSNKSWKPWRLPQFQRNGPAEDLSADCLLLRLHAESVPALQAVWAATVHALHGES